MLKSDSTCFMPQGMLSMDVPMMVFQIMKLKERQTREAPPPGRPDSPAARPAAHSHGHDAGVLPVPLRDALQLVGGAQRTVHIALLRTRDHVVGGDLAAATRKRQSRNRQSGAFPTQRPDAGHLSKRQGHAPARSPD